MHKAGGRLSVVFRILPQIEAKSGVKCVLKFKTLKIFIYLSKAQEKIVLEKFCKTCRSKQKNPNGPGNKVMSRGHSALTSEDISQSEITRFPLNWNF